MRGITSASVIFLVLSSAVFLVGISGSSSPVDLTDDLVLRYDFTGTYEDGDRIEDLSPAANDGVYVGPEANQSNQSSDSLFFSEETGYVHVQLTDELSADFTLRATVHNEYHDYYAGIIAGESWRLVAPYGTYEFGGGESALRYDVDDHGTWYQLAVVREDSTVRLYVDGKLVASETADSVPSEDTLFIGQRPGGYPYHGNIAEISIHDRALSTEEVRGTYTDRRTIRPVLYSDRFRTGAVLGVVCLVVLLAHVEGRIRSR